jgi:hypothetical protein
MAKDFSRKTVIKKDIKAPSLQYDTSLASIKRDEKDQVTPTSLFNATVKRNSMPNTEQKKKLR